MLTAFAALLKKENLIVAALTGIFVFLLYFTRPAIDTTVDFVLFYKANFDFLRESLRHWELPLWNPCIGLGRPFLADTQNAVFYPPTYLALLPGPFGLFLFTWFHSLTGVFGMRALGGSLGLSKGASYLAAFSFIAMAPITARWFTGQLLYAGAICYLPWLFFFATELDRNKSAQRLFAYALVTALQFLCGHPQIFWLSILGQGAFLLARSASFRSTEDTIKWTRELLAFSAVVLWATTMAAVVLFPFFDLVRLGNRAASSPALAASGAMEWGNFISLIAIGSRDEINWERNLYVGVPLFIAGIAGLLKVRDRNIRALLIVLVFGLLLSVGRELPTFRLFFDYLPGYAKFRIHARSGLLICFVLLLGAGSLVSRPSGWIVSAWEKVMGYSMRNLFVLFATTVAASLVLMNVSNKRSYGPDSPAGGGGGYPFQRELVARLNELRAKTASIVPPRVLVPSFLVPPNAAMTLEFSNPDAYTSLFLKRPWDYLHKSIGLVPSEELNSFLPMEIFGQGPFPYRDLDLAMGYDSTNQTLVINTNPLPRAFLVYATQACSNYDSVFDQVKAIGRPAEVAVVETNMDWIGRARRPWRAGSLIWNQENLESSVGNHSVRFLTYQRNELRLEAVREREGLLILLEAWYPGWRCEVDGKLVDSIPVNGWMRGFIVPAGNGPMRVFYHQRGLWLGLAVSAVAILLGFLLLWKQRHVSQQH